MKALKEIQLKTLLVNVLMVTALGLMSAAVITLVIAPAINSDVVVNIADVALMIQQVASAFRLVMLVYSVIMVIFCACFFIRQKTLQVENLLHTALILVMALLMPVAARALVVLIW